MIFFFCLEVVYSPWEFVHDLSNDNKGNNNNNDDNNNDDADDKDNNDAY